MLFNSYDFIFLFLIPVLLGWFVLKTVYAHKGVRLQPDPLVCIYYLIGVSVVFYAQWSLEHLAILLGSVVFNYGFAFLFAVLEKKGVRSSSYPFFFKNYLYVVIFLNLLPLVYYKYSGLLSMGGSSLVLPLAISFFTFQQIAFQVDLDKGKIKLEGFDKYLFFVLFFPQLVAGPIVHYNDLVGQIKKRWLTNAVSQGILLFSIGLFKKVVLADSLAVYANSAFGDVASLSFYDAWVGLFAYSFQIYFDFSGYADMAIGLALLFGFRLPINFLSPYKSRNIVEFWRNWHITLSDFLKEHLYIPLGGNRLGMGRSVINLLVTMTIGGIWHGAGWTFVLWGFLHGVFLGVVHGLGNILTTYRSIDRYKQNGVRLKPYPILFISTFFTFMVVTLLWVLFRADGFGDALTYYGVLFDFDGFMEFVTSHKTGSGYILALLFSGVVVFLLPNSMEFSGYVKENGSKPLHKKGSGYSLRSFYAAILFFISLKVMANTPALTFVYFNF